LIITFNILYNKLLRSIIVIALFLFKQSANIPAPLSPMLLLPIYNINIYVNLILR